VIVIAGLVLMVPYAVEWGASMLGVTVMIVMGLVLTRKDVGMVVPMVDVGVVGIVMGKDGNNKMMVKL
jgi:hypothetical protein